ncbi:MAG: hypothetical protein Q4A65_00280 [Bacillota bacterium]|nr:hypothetical protein [Bacillota bacterium]
MRSMTSSSEIKTILRDNFKKYWTVPALGLFWLLVWGFVPTLLSGSDMENLRMMAANENFGYVSGILILAIGSGMTVFSYLRDPGAANYIHSLPVSRKKLYLANILSGILMIAGPLVVNAAVMSALAGSLLFVKWLIITAVSCFAIFSITVFAAAISGNTLMHLFNSGLICSLVTGVTAVIYAACQSLLLGYDTPRGLLNFMYNANPLMPFISPGKSIVMLGIIYLAVGLAALLIGWLLYARRPIERTGSSLIFPWTRAGLLIICVFCGAILSGLFFAEIFSDLESIKFGSGMITGMVIGALIVFVVGSVMIDRSARIFTKRNLIPAALSLVLAFAVTAGLSADITGYGSKIPAANEVETAYVDLSSIDLFGTMGEMGAESGGYQFRYDANNYILDGAGTYKFPDTEIKVIGMNSGDTIDAVRDLHKSLMNQDSENGSWDDDVQIVYQLKNGKEMRRCYSIYTSNSDAKDPRKYIDPAVRGAAKKIYESEEFKTRYSLHNIKPGLLEHSMFTYNRTVYKNGQEQDEYIQIPNQKVPELIKAMEQDFQENSYEESLVYETFIDVTPNDYFYGDGLILAITKDSKHTKAWLDDNL